MKLLQRAAGNRAANALMAGKLTAQRDPTGTGTETAPAPETDEQKRIARLKASYATAITDKNWRQVARDLNGFNDADIETNVALMLHDQLIEVDSQARQTMIGWHERVTGAIAKFDSEADRVGELTAKYETAISGKQWDEAIVHLNGFNETDIISKLSKLSPEQLRHMSSAAKDTKVGGGRMARFVNAAAGITVKTQQDEQVGGTVYTVQGGYTYSLVPGAMRISVGMNFKPDSGVAVPVDTWFGHIRNTWNHFSAVNQEDRAEKYAIEFVPVSGPGHDIQVSDHSDDGQNRANAGHYYLQDTRAASTVPHEFGHLIGLEDEYERDAADYQRVTGEAAPAGSAADTATAVTVATGIHDALFEGEKLFEFHRTAERRRRSAVENVLREHHITARYQGTRTPLTREVSIQYATKYGHEMSVDFRSQIDTDNDEFNNWREQVLGAFQVTSTSIMGDMSDHDHPVAPRHVRTFANHLQQTLGRGTWVPEQDH